MVSNMEDNTAVDRETAAKNYLSDYSLTRSGILNFLQVAIRVDRSRGNTCSYVCPQTWLKQAQTNIALSQTIGFLNENITWAFLCILDNCYQVCP